MELENMLAETPPVSAPHQTCFYLLLYAEVANEAQAAALAEVLLRQLHACVPVASHKFFPYWKIPTYYGFEFDFAPLDSYDQAFDRLVALCPTGWVFVGDCFDRSAVWNPIEGAIFLAEPVRWVHIDLHY